MGANITLPPVLVEIYDSGWFAVSQGVNYVKTLGFTSLKPTKIELWYSDTNDGSGDLVTRNASAHDTANQQLCVVDLDLNSITIRSEGKIAQYRAANGTYKDPTSGYARIMAERRK